VLVVAHHAALAYPTFGQFNPDHYILSTAPIVDDQRWRGMDLFIGFNDVFFMPLMFLISGLFVWRGLCKKGPGAYLLDRFSRLGIPFIVAELVLIPLAYWPSYYRATGSTNFRLFVTDYVINQQWPVGPPWFIWLLLAYSCVVVLVYLIRPASLPTAGQWLMTLGKRPLRLGIILYLLTGLSLIPLSLWIGHYTWVGSWGPFDFQQNRLLFYGFFYGVGCCVGATNWQAYVLPNGKLFGTDWRIWAGSSLCCYALLTVESGYGADLVRNGYLSPTLGYLVYDLFFIASCLASLSGCMGFFGQVMIRPNDYGANLSANAYGIYLVHYVFITWLQFALLMVAWPVIIKFGIVFAGALSLSWCIVHLLRKNSLIGDSI